MEENPEQTDLDQDNTGLILVIGLVQDLVPGTMDQTLEGLVRKDQEGTDSLKDIDSRQNGGNRNRSQSKERYNSKEDNRRGRGREGYRRNSKRRHYRGDNKGRESSERKKGCVEMKLTWQQNVQYNLQDVESVR